MTDYLKIGKAADLVGRDKKLYRFLEIIPGALSLGTLIVLLILSYLKPIWTTYFIIIFDVYWLLLVTYLSLHLIAAYRKLQKNSNINWSELIRNLKSDIQNPIQDIYHLILLPTYTEGLEIIRPTVQALANSSYPLDKIIVVLGIEEREGMVGKQKAEQISKEFKNKFGNFLITTHPDNIEGELKGKGANQTWMAKQAKDQIIDKQKLDYDKILVSVFDIDTIVPAEYFSCLTYKFLTTDNPYRASYQPVPVYNNNIWQSSFFARVAASSNTFWQMMQQIRQEKLATYSSHSMTFRALIDIKFWSTNMVSEDSRIFWHCFCYYNGDYRVEPLHFPISMDVTMDKTIWQTAKNLYKQQRRWGWGVENLPYLFFNIIKKWKVLPKKKAIKHALIQFYGFHSWATNALIIGIIGWMPFIWGGNNFHATVLSGNFPIIARILMTFAMIGMIVSAIISTLLLPKRPKEYSIKKNIVIILQWLILPLSIIIFGSFPAIEAQTRLMLGKYMGFFVTPKKR